jgi:hypothetical protein
MNTLYSNGAGCADKIVLHAFGDVRRVWRLRPTSNSLFETGLFLVKRWLAPPASRGEDGKDQGPGLRAKPQQGLGFASVDLMAHVTPLVRTLW